MSFLFINNKDGPSISCDKSTEDVSTIYAASWKTSQTATYIMTQESCLFLESQLTKVTLNVFRCPMRSVRDIRVRVWNAIPLERRAFEFQLTSSENPRAEATIGSCRLKRRRGLNINFAFFRWTIFDRSLFNRLVGSALVASPVASVRHSSWWWTQAGTMESCVAFTT